jgi:hypothetical protein
MKGKYGLFWKECLVGFNMRVMAGTGADSIS